MEVGRTECIMDNLNPVWQKKINLDYNFEQRQMLRLRVYDLDSDSVGSKLESQDFLGMAECSLGEVVSKQSSGFSKELTNGGGAKIFIAAEEMSSNKEEAILQFSAKGLDKMDWFGKSDPFLEFSRSTESNKYILVHRSEVIKNTRDPEWRQFNIKVRALCNGDDDRDIKVDVYDWNRSGDHEIIGTFHTNMRKLREGPGPDNVYDVVNEKKRKKKGSKYKNSGTVNLRKSEVHLVPSFLDYIQGGTQVNFTLAVDFTASNGNPMDPNSLHYRGDPSRPNQYCHKICRRDRPGLRFRFHVPGAWLWCTDTSYRTSVTRVLPHPGPKPALLPGDRRGARGLPQLLAQRPALRTNQLLPGDQTCGQVRRGVQG